MTNSLEEFIKEELSKIKCFMKEHSIDSYSLDGFFCDKCNSKDLTFFGLIIKDSCVYEAYHDGKCENCGNKLRVYLKTIIDFEAPSDEEK